MNFFIFNKFPARSVVLGLSLFLAVSAGVEAQDPEPAAVLAVVAGEVRIQRGNTSLDGSFGAALQAGDVVQTGVDAQAAVLFESGQIIELGSESKISIGALPTKQSSPVMAEMPSAFSGSLDRFTVSGDASLSVPIDLRGGGSGEEPQPIAPRNTLVSPGSVRFSWEPVEDVLEYRVILSGPGDLAGTHAASQTTWIPSPETEFASGERWTWQVEAVTPDGSILSESVAFEVAEEAKWRELESLEQQLEPLLQSEDRTRRDAASYLLGSYCRSIGFYGDAIVHLEALVDRHSGRKELHRELGSVYQAVGRNDKAVEAYKRALAH